MRLSRRIAHVAFLVCSIHALGQNISVSSPADPIEVKGEHSLVRDARCSESSVTFPFLLSSEVPPSPGDDFQRASIRFDDTTEIQVYQRKVPTADGAFDSTIVIKTDGENPGQERFPVSRFVQNGQGLWLFQSRTVCGKLDKQEMILGFMLGGVDAGQGFLVIDRFSGRARVRALPKIVEHGKLIIFHENFRRAQLWGATDFGSCEACKKHYMVEDCELGTATVVCAKQPKLRGPFYPNAITENIIEVR
jgi:hypothetical protein